MQVNTLCQRFLETASKLGDADALHDDTTTLTWRDFASRAETLAFGFRELGLREGDTAALVTRNTGTFHVVDMAVMLAGATPFSIAGNEPAERVAEFLRVADCSLVLVEDGHLDLVREALRDRVDVTVVRLDAQGASQDEFTLSQVEARGSEPDSRDQPLSPVTDPERLPP